MLRLLLLRGFGLLTGGIGLTLGLGDPGLAVERLRLRIDQAGQCLSSVTGSEETSPDEPSPSLPEAEDAPPSN